jgi:hypothetical protein
VALLIDAIDPAVDPTEAERLVRLGLPVCFFQYPT